MVLIIVAPRLKHRRLRDDVRVAALGGVGRLDARGLDVACAAALEGGRISLWSWRVGEDEWGRKGEGGAYAGGVGAVALVAEGAFADDVAVGVAGRGGAC